MKNKKLLIAFSVVMLAVAAIFMYLNHENEFVKDLAKRADAGIAESQIAVANCYHYGFCDLHISKKWKERKYLTMALMQGKGKALLDLDCWHASDTKKGLECYNTALSASEKGDWLFFCEMGDLVWRINHNCDFYEKNKYLNKFCSEHNDLNPVTWYDKTMQSGVSLAPNMKRYIARDYFSESSYKAETAEEKENLNKSFNLLSQAAEEGDTEAKVLLARLYRLGLGAKQDMKKAYSLYYQAFLEGHAGAFGMLSSNAQYGFSENSSFVDEIIKKADSGIAESQFFIAHSINYCFSEKDFCHELRKRISEDMASEYMLMAARQGYLQAIYHGSYEELIDDKIASEILKKSEKGNFEDLEMLQKIYFGYHKGKFQWLSNEYLKKAEKILYDVLENRSMIASDLSELSHYGWFYYNFGDFFQDSDREKAVKYFNKSFEYGNKLAWERLKELKAL